MAAGRIKGITIEIGGNATPLVKALASVDNAISKTQKNLNDINKALKFDPGNTALLKDKQIELANAIDETKKKDIKQVNKELGSLLEFKTEITKTPEDYVAGVANMFNSMIKAHLLANNPEKADQINDKLKCNEKSELIPAAKRVAIMSAGMGGDINPEKEESEEERIAREKELSAKSATDAFMNFIEQTRQEQEELAQVEAQNEEAERIAEIERQTLAKAKKQQEIEEQEKQEQEEMQRMMTRNKYDD